MNNIEMLNVNCMDYMKGLPDNTFDICITSPPYNMNLRVNGKGDGYCSRQVVKEVSTKYENFADNLPMVDYQKFLSEFIRESNRICRITFLNIQQITGNKPALFSAIGENASILKETIVWDKTRSQPSIAKNVLNSQFEFIFVFGDNPITRQFTQANFNRGTESNVFRIPPTRSHDKNHRAGFPVELPSKILSLVGKPESIVFDPFAGTGTTGIAAMNYGCDFVGCELDESYYNSAVSRIADAKIQMPLL